MKDTWRDDKFFPEHPIHSDTLLTISGELLWTIDRRGVIRSSSKNSKKTLGRKLADLIGHPIFDFIPETDTKHFNKKYRKFLSIRKPFTGMELVLLHKNKSQRTMEMSGIPIVDAKGIFRGYHCVLRDITKQKFTEQSLYERENIYQTLLETNDTAYVILDGKGHVVDANIRYVVLTGHKILSEIIGKNVVSWTAPYDRKRNAEAVKKCQREGYVRNFEVEYIHKNGTIVPIEINASVLDAEHGKRIFTICRDITERKRLSRIQNAVLQIMHEAEKDSALDHLFKSVHKIISTIIPAKNFYISLYNEQQDILSFPYFVDEYDATPSPSKPGKGLTEYVMRTGESLLCDDAIEKELVRQGEIDRIGPPSPIWLGVPLKIKNKTIGVMVAQDYTNPNAFRREEKQLFEFISTQLAHVVARKQAEAVIKANEERYRLISTVASDYMFSTRLTESGDLILDWVTGAFEEITGYSFDEYVARGGWRAALHPEDKDIDEKAMNKLRANKPSTSEVRTITKNGSTIWTRSYAHPVWDKKRKKLIGIYGAVQNITQRKNAEESLYKSTEKIRAMYNTLTDGITFTDLNGNITEVNNAVLKMHGYKTKEELIGHNALELIVETDQQRALDILKQTYETGKSNIIEYKFKKKDGNEFDAELNSVMLKDIQGNPAGFVALTRDITARKLVDKKLHENESRYRFISDNIEDVIWTWSFNTGKFTYCSPSVQKMRGYTPEEILNQTLADALTPESAEIATHQLQQAIADRKAGDAKPRRYINYVEQPCKNGSVVSVEIATTLVFDENGEPMEVIGVTRDITERVKHDEILKRYQLLSNNSRDIMLFVRASDGQILEANHAATSAYGYTDLTTKNIRDLRPSEANSLVRKQLEQADRTGITFETTHKRKDGSTFPVEVSSTGMTLNGERVLLSVIRDITDRKQAEESVRESQANLQAIIESTSDIIALYDRDVRLVSYNRACSDIYREFFGIELNPGIRTLDFFPKSTWNYWVANNERALSGESFSSEFNIPSEDGQIRHFESFYNPISYNDVVVGFSTFTRDITERKRAEETLAQSEEKFRSVVEKALVGIYILDDNFKYMYVNDEACKILGYPREELIDNDFRKVMAPESIALVVDRYKRRQAGEQLPSRYELNTIRSDGEIRNLEMSVAAFKDSAGKARTIGQFNDITERKRAEESLKRSEEQFRGITQNIPGLVFQFYARDNGEFGLNYVSNRSNEILGIQDGQMDVIYKRFVECIADEDREKFIDSIKTAVKTVSPWVYEGKYIRPNGEEKYFRGLSQPRMIGNELVFDGILLDISEQKLTTMALAKSEEKYRRIVDTANEGIWILDKNSITTFVNNRMVEMLGYSVDELIEKRFTDFLFPEDVIDHENRIDNRSRGVNERYERRMKCKDGRTLWVLISGTPVLDDKKQFSGAFGMFVDITERKLAEEQLKQIATLQQTILDASSLAISFVKDRKIQWTNSMMLKMFGYTEDEIIGQRSSLMYKNDEEYLRIGEKAYQQLAKGEIYNTDIEFKKKDGSLFWGNLLGKAINPEKPLEGSIWMAQDITERKTAEEKFKQLADLHQTIIDTMTVGITYVKDRKTQWSNKEFQKMLGYDESEIIGADTSFIYKYQEDYRRVGIDAYPHLSRGEIYSIELEAKRKDNSTLWIGLVGKAIDPGKPYEGTIWMLQDITGRTKAEAALRESEKKYRSVIENIQDVFYRADVDGEIIMGSPSGAKLFGYSSVDEMIGMKIENFWVNQEDRDTVLTIINESGKIREFETQFIRKDGTSFTASLSAHIFYNDEGKPQGTEGIIRDISDRKITEEKIKIMTDLHQTILDTTSVGLVFMKDRKHVWCNNAFSSILGYTTEELIGSPSSANYVYKEEYEKVGREGYPLLAKGEIYTMETLHKRKDGTHIWLIISGKALNPNDLSDGSVWMVQDITKRKQAEEEIIKLASLNQAILDTVSVGIIYVKDRKTVWTNKAISNIFGYKSDELIGKDTSIYYANMDMHKKIGTEAYNKLVQGETYFIELQGRRKDGTVFWAYLTSKAINPQNIAEGSIWVVQDVTEYKNAELAIRKSESLLKATMESMNDGILVVGSDDMITHTNTRFKEIFSIPEELITLSDDKTLVNHVKQQLSNPDDFVEHVKEIYRTTLPSEDTLQFVNGKIVERHSYPLMEDSPLKGRVWLFRDVTEKRKAEDALVKNQRFLQESQRVANIGCWEMDLQSTILTWNEETYNIYGYKYQEFEPTFKSFVSLIHPDDRHIVISHLEETMRSKEFKDLESRMIRPDGGIRTILLVGAVSVDETGKPYRTVGIVQDITERKKSEEKLKQNEARLRIAQAIAHLGYWEIDLVSQTIKGSEEAARIYGVEPKGLSLPLESVQRAVLPQYRSMLDDALRNLIEGTNEYDVESQIKRIDTGEIRWMHSKAELVIDSSGKPIKVIGTIQDISERKFAEEALKESKERLQSFMDSAIDAFTIWDKNLKLLDLNKTALAYLPQDTQKEDIRGKYLTDFLPYLKEGNRLEKYINVLKTGDPNSGEEEILYPSNKSTWTDTRIFKVGDGLGIVTSDITQKKHAEFQLREQDAKLRSIFRATPVSIGLTTNRDFHDCNDAFFRMTGYSPGEIIGKNARLIYPTEEEYIRVGSEQVRQMKAQSTDTIETRWLQKNGGIINILLRFVALDLSDLSKGVIFSALDITERKRMETLVQQSEIRYRTTIDSLNDYIHVVDSDLRIILMNETFIELNKELGLVTDVIGRNIFEIFPFLPKTIQDEYKHIFDTGEPLITEETTQLPDRFMITETRKVPIFEGDRVDRVLTIVHDITIRKQSEEQIRRLNETLEERVKERTVQLEAVNKELEAFAYSISHDLRAPLRAIDGYTRILVEDYQKSMDDEGNRVCSVIRTETQRMGQLIDELLAFSRLGRLTMHPSSIDLVEITQTVFNELTTPETRKRIELRVGSLPSVMGDRMLLHQALVNLISNAIKFSSKREQAVIEIGSMENDGETVYFIRDNGAGFDMQYIPKLFGVFQRLHSEREFEGNGVGLAIVQRVLTRHGGRIWAEGAIDKGATFYFTIPGRKGLHDES
jgi:PAS domain S-box-containing protein